MKSGVKWLMLPLMLLMLGNTAFSQELITDGDMEGSAGQNKVPPAFTIIAGSPDMNLTGDWPHFSASHFWDWVGIPKASPVGGSWENVIAISGTAPISESFSRVVTGLQIGRKYTFRYYYASTPTSNNAAFGQPAGTNVNDSRVAPIVTADNLTGIVNPAANGSQWAWIGISQQLTATATSATINFKVAIPASGANSGYIGFDGISLIGLPCVATTISVQPVNAAVCSGVATSFTGAVSGTGPFTYQWLYNGTALSADHSDGNGTYTGSTTPTLNITPTGTFFNGALFSLRATNVCGTVTTTNAGTLTVNTPPTAVTILSNGPYCRNATATAFAAPTFSGTAAGATYQWWSNGSPIGGATSSTYTPSTTIAGNSTYAVTVSNGCGSTSSNVITVTVNVAPTITVQPAVQTICAGSGFSYTGAASGTAPLTYTWQASGDAGVTWYNQSNGTFPDGVFSGAGTATLTATNVTTAANNRRYRLHVTNTCGSTDSNVQTLTVNSAPAITTQPATQTICSGSGFSYTGAASGTAPLTYTWQASGDAGVTWYNQSNGTFPDGVFSGAGTATLTATNVTTAANNRRYRLHVSNTCGSTDSNVQILTVNPTPTAPTLSVSTAANACPLLTANLTTLVNSATPAGATLEFHTSATPTVGNLVPLPALVLGGTYYAFYRNTAGGCYSPASAAITVSINACATAVQLSAKIFLEGAYTSGTTMRNDLLTGAASGVPNLIPTNQPYGANQSALATYNGTEAVTAFPATAVDWVLVQLRSTLSGAPVAAKAGILLQNGNIVDVAAGFASPLTFTAAAGNYFIVVRHRNHLAVMSSTAQALTATATTYDFTTAENKAYNLDGNNTSMIQLSGGQFALWGGDANHDGQVFYYSDGNDREAILNTFLASDANSGYNNNYENGDVNMDGQTYYYSDGNDREWILNQPLKSDANNGYLSEQVP